MATSLTIKASMEDRWVPHFLGLLREMERLGKVGSSRVVGIYADGDGDFHPRFEWDASVEPADPTPATVETDMLWDAG